MRNTEQLVVGRDGSTGRPPAGNEAGQQKLKDASVLHDHFKVDFVGDVQLLEELPQQVKFTNTRQCDQGR